MRLQLFPIRSQSRRSTPVPLHVSNFPLTVTFFFVILIMIFLGVALVIAVRLCGIPDHVVPLGTVGVCLGARAWLLPSCMASRALLVPVRLVGVPLGDPIIRLCV